MLQSGTKLQQHGTEAAAVWNKELLLPTTDDPFHRHNLSVNLCDEVESIVSSLLPFRSESVALGSSP